MRYMGLDVSQTSTGVAVIDDFEYSVGFTIRSKPQQGVHPIQRNRAIINDVLAQVHEGHEYCVMIENYAFGKMMRMSMIAELTGQIKMSLVREKAVPYNRLWLAPPTLLKKYILGHGKAEKSQILKAVFKKWGYDTGQDDIADAYGLARLAKDVFTFITMDKYPTLAYEADCVQAVAASNDLIEKATKAVRVQTRNSSEMMGEMPKDPRIAMGVPSDID